MIHERPSAARGRLRECLIDRYAALASETGAIDLTLGTDDRPMPPELLAALARELPLAERYPDFAGEPSLRTSVAAARTRRDGIATAADEVVITAGATGGIASALMELLGPGDELVTFAPGYSIPLAVALERGVRVRAAPLRVTGDGEHARWSFDPDAVASLFGPRTRVLLLTSPHSPTGKVFTAHELGVLVELCRRSGAFLVHDAVYEDFELDGPVLSPRALHPWGTVVVGSASKALRAPGLRIGWVTAPRKLAERIGKVQERATAGACLPAQRAVAEVLAAGSAPPVSTELRERHERVRRALACVGLECVPAQGGLCFVARATPGSSAPGLATKTDEDLARGLLARGIAGVPLCEFGPRSMELGPAVRIGFARGERTLARLDAAVRE